MLGTLFWSVSRVKFSKPEPLTNPNPFCRRWNFSKYVLDCTEMFHEEKKVVVFEKIWETKKINSSENAKNALKMVFGKFHVGIFLKTFEKFLWVFLASSSQFRFFGARICLKNDPAKLIQFFWGPKYYAARPTAHFVPKTEQTRILFEQNFWKMPTICSAAISPNFW